MALGAKLGWDTIRDSAGKNPKYVCHIVGDGSYMCSSPASAAWVAAKYKVPILTVVVNNGGKSFLLCIYFPSFLLSHIKAIYPILW